MSKVKYTSVTTTIEGAIADAYSELQELRDEMSEWRDNLEERFSHTDKYSQVSDAADALDQIADDAPEVDGPLGDITVTASHGRKASTKSPYPRWLRRDNATSLMDGAISALEDHIATLDEKITELETAIEELEKPTAERTAEIASALADYKLNEISIDSLTELKDQLETEKSTAEELRDQLDSHKSEAEAVEFPGMYG